MRNECEPGATAEAAQRRPRTAAGRVNIGRFRTSRPAWLAQCKAITKNRSPQPHTPIPAPRTPPKPTHLQHILDVALPGGLDVSQDDVLVGGEGDLGLGVGVEGDDLRGWG